MKKSTLLPLVLIICCLLSGCVSNKEYKELEQRVLSLEEELDKKDKDKQSDSENGVDLNSLQSLLSKNDSASEENEQETDTETADPEPNYEVSIDFANLKVGSYITIGRYEQDNDLDNGKEPLGWEVLDIDGDKALIITEFVIEAQKYNDEGGECTWETCSLRKWLNNDFYNNSFSQNERAYICETHNTPEEFERKPKWSETTDNVFCLSISELKKYYNPPCMYNGYYSEELIIPPTLYSEGKVRTEIFNASAETLEIFGYSENARGKAGADWWLRTPGYNDYGMACLVDYAGVSGELDNYIMVDSTETGVRPAMWIRIE